MDYATLRIRKPDDSNTYWNCKFQVLGENGNPRNGIRTYDAQRYGRNGTASADPITDGIAHILPHILGMPRRRGRWDNHDLDFSRTLLFENGFAILVEKQNTRYKVMGKMVSKTAMLITLAKVLYVASQGAKLSKLFSVMNKHLDIPENVSYALENRAPYHWYEGGVPNRVSLRIAMISDKMCAIEISDGIWADIKTKDMNSFLNFYRHNRKNSSWKNLSPARLWIKLMGKEPTEGQLKLMKAFLLQNRTKDLVEKRAQELMRDLENQYPDRIKIREKDGRTWMYVRGKIADWALSDTGMKAGTQMVTTYSFAAQNDDEEHTSYKKLQHGHLRGAICIDNMTNNSTLGDQFATRAIAMMNDVITIQRVNTIRRYIPEEEGFEIGQEKHRMNWDEL